MYDAELTFKEPRKSNSGLTPDQKRQVKEKLEKIIAEYDSNPKLFQYLPHLESKAAE